jgi:hypothetical protein
VTRGAAVVPAAKRARRIERMRIGIDLSGTKIEGIALDD